MNILSIGNSFSQDAQRYVHQIARADGIMLNAFNLYIGGCPLSFHYRNMLSEQQNYFLEMNGVNTNFKVSLKEALLNRDWDVITIQQVSSQSWDYQTYQPYLNEVISYVRACVPKAQIAIHQTWAYEQDSRLLNEKLGYEHHTDMFCDIKAAYEKAAKEIKADFIIPSGEVFQRMIASGIEKVHRDTYHASLGLGRYALGLTWYSMLTGNDVSSNAFSDFDEDVLQEQMTIAKQCAAEVTAQYKMK